MIRKVSSLEYRSVKESVVQKLFTGFRPVDFLTAIYISGIAAILLFFHNTVTKWPLFILTHLVVLAAIWLLIRIEKNTHSKILTLLRDIYPLLLFTFMFLEVSKIIHIFFPFWLEPYLIGTDLWLFGVHPAVWVESVYNPHLMEFMAFSYWTYYFFFPLGMIVHYFRKDRTTFHSYIFTISFAMYFCYFSYLFLTARGPHDSLAYLQVTHEYAGFFDRLIRTMQSRASIHGAAFPSSHVAAVWIVLIYLFKYKKWVGYVSLPLVLSLSVSVIFMQYHYAVDSLAGILIVPPIYYSAQYFQKKLDFNRLMPQENVTKI